VVDDEARPDAPPAPDAPDTGDTAATEAALAVAARHALHDEELVAALATDSLEEAADVLRAQGLVDRCTACRELHRDLAAIGAALRVDAKGTLAAPRDFRLTVADAQRLGGRVVVRGYLATFRRSIVSFGRPIGASMAALGVVGLLVGSVALGGGAAGAPTSAGNGPVDASSAPAEVQTGSEQTGGPKSSDRSGAYGPVASAYLTGGDDPPRDSTVVGANPAGWLLGGSVALLIAGLALLVIALRRSPHGGIPTREP
jgi:hypothetical protein